jgi:uncharacterized coiled-coil protein SlyX
MADEAQTQPMLETLLRELRDFRASVEKRFEKMDTWLDRIESMVNTTRGEMLEMRADFRDLRSKFKEFRSQFKQPA